VSYFRPIGDDAKPAAAVSGSVLLMIAGIAALVFWPERRRKR
jgi:hypothetical protein